MAKGKGTFRILCLIVLLRLLLGAALFNHAGGFFMLTGDDVIRTLDAYAWARDMHNFRFNMWLPLPLVITGIGLKFFPYFVVVPAVINSVFTLGTILTVFFLTRRLFENNDVIALGAVMLAAFYDKFIWLSLSGLPYPLFHFFIIAGFFCWAGYLEGRARLLPVAAAAFLLSTMVRYEGWMFAGIFSGFVLKDAFARGAISGKRRAALIACGIIALSFVPLWIFYQGHFHGDALHVLKSSREDLAAFMAHSYSRIGVFKKNLLRYPGEILESGKLVTVLAAVAFFLAVRRKKRAACLAAYFIILEFVALTISSLFSIGSFAYPRGPVLVNILLLMPLASYGLYSICRLSGRRRFAVFFWGTIMLGLVFNIKSAFIYNLYTGRDAVRSGKLLYNLWNKDILSAEDKVLLEERIDGRSGRAHKTWECNSIYLYNPGRIIFDREKNYILKGGDWVLKTDNNPSVFDLPADKFRKYLSANHCRIAVVNSEAVKTRLREFMVSLLQFGEYEFFALPQDKVLAGKAQLNAGRLKAGVPDRNSLGDTVKIRIEAGGVITPDFLGAGAEFDPFGFMPENIRRGFNEEDWTLLSGRIRRMGLDIVRMWYQPDWHEPYNDDSDPGHINWNGFAFDSKRMRSVYRYLDLCQSMGCGVNLVFGWKRDTPQHSWLCFRGISPVRSAPSDLKEWAESCSALLQYLLNTKGYTCVKYLTLFNEPNTGEDFEVPAGIDEKDWYKQMYEKVDERLRLDGIRDKIKLVAPDEAGGGGWLDEVLPDLDDIVDVYAGHLHTHSGIELGEFCDAWRRKILRMNPDGIEEPFYLAEFGGVRDAELRDSFDYGLILADLVITALNHGAAAMTLWRLSDIYLVSPIQGTHLPADLIENGRQKQGLWEYRDKGWLPRYSYYAYSLITGYTDRGGSILKTGSSDPDISAAVVKSSQGRYSIFVLNKADMDKRLSVKFGSPAKMPFKRHVYDSNVKRTAGAEIIPVSAVIEGGLEFADTVPKRSFAVYEQRD